MKSIELTKRAIEKLYKRGKAKNPGFSIAQLARNMGVPEQSLGGLSRGKHKISTDMAEKLFRNRIPSQELEELQLQIEKEKSKSHHLYKHSPEDVLEFELDPVHGAVFALANLKFKKRDAEEFAFRLDLPLKTVESAIDRLIRMGLLNGDKSRDDYLGLPERSRHYYRLSEFTDEQALDRRQRVTKLVMGKLPNLSKDEYSSFDYIFSASAKDLEMLRTKLKRFVHEIASVEKKSFGDVYCFNSVIAPISRLRRSKKTRK